jgi:hypothetical protein
MSLLRSIKNALSGRTRHWNEHNTARWKELWARAELLPSPGSDVLKCLLMGSWIFVDSLLGPKRTLDLGIDSLQLTGEQLAHVHVGFLEYAAGLLVAREPLLTDFVLEPLPVLTGRDASNSSIIVAARTYPGDVRTASHLAIEKLKVHVSATLRIEPGSDPLIDRNVEVHAASSLSVVQKGVEEGLRAWSAGEAA